MGRFTEFHAGRGLEIAQTPAHAGMDFSGFGVTPEHVENVARAYMALPDYDPKAVPAFHAMAEETKRQFDSLGRRGISVEVTKEDPYDNYGQLADDLRNNSRIKVMATASTGGHPIFNNDTNDMFRAVHDVYGHAATGRDFSRHGEEAAFQAHRRMYSPLARAALTSETRGQNAALIQTGGFQTQKVALLPARMQGTALVTGRRSSGNLGPQFKRI